MNQAQLSRGKPVVMNYVEAAGLSLIGLLFFIWPVPGTITVRTIVSYLCLAIFTFMAVRNGLLRGKWRRPGLPFVFWFLFLFWAVVQALFISPETSWAMKEIAGQFGNGTLSLAMGAALAISSENSAILSKKNIFLILFWTLAVHILYVDISAIVISIKAGRVVPFATGLTAGHEQSSYLTVYLFLLLATDVFSRVVCKKKLVEVGSMVLASVAALALLSIYFETARNGTASVAVVSVILAALFFREAKFSIRTPVVVLIVIAVISSLIYVSVRTDQRWKTVLETVPLALDTKNNKAWLDPGKYPLPKLQNGQPLEGSAYQRIAWLKEGIILVVENPLGIGFGRSAFGHGIKRKYGEGTIGFHSHSGILDVAIGTGLPGLALWLVFLVSLAVVSLRQFRKYKSYSAFLLFFIVVAFGLRMAVDSIVRDHMLQQFMFLVGLLWIFMMNEKKTSKAQSMNGIWSQAGKPAE